MKFNKIITLLFASLFFIGLQAQELSKSEKKALKKEIKQLLKEPVKYKFLKEKIVVKDVIINEQNQDLKKINQEKNILVNKLNEARDSIGFYQNKINEIVPATECADDSGMRYRVQIGLYEEFDISSFFEEIKVTRFENFDGKFRYTIGNFKTEDEAELFKDAIRKMGIVGAFVSHYLDGTRVPK